MRAHSIPKHTFRPGSMAFPIISALKANHAEAHEQGAVQVGSRWWGGSDDVWYSQKKPCPTLLSTPSNLSS